MNTTKNLRCTPPEVLMTPTSDTFRQLVSGTPEIVIADVCVSTRAMRSWQLQK